MFITSNLLLEYESSIHNIAFFSEEFVSSEIEEKYAQLKHCWQAKRVQNSPKQVCWWILMWADKSIGPFHWRKH